MKLTTITRGGKKFVLVPVDQYQRLTDDARPQLPPVSTDGTSNAIEFARASLARQLIQDRRAAGLSQQQLAKLAGVRQETIPRIESGKHTATVRVIDRLDRAIQYAAKLPSRRSCGKQLERQSS